MKTLLRRAAPVGFLWLLLPSSVAFADTPPSAWDLARDPGERERFALHVRVERLLHPPADEELQPTDNRRDAELRLEAARALLEQVDAEHSPDVRLRFDLGIVYEQLGDAQGQREDLYRRSAEVLAAALETAPDHPAATQALELLAYAYVRLDRPRDELATWRRYLARLSDDRSRVVDMMNMGEAEMRLGLVDDALDTFHEVLRICSELPGGSSTYLLTLWDIAVALDRSGDARGALDTAAKAASMAAIGSNGLPMTGRAIIARDPKVFFVPEWEREWYLALASSAAARDEKDPRDASTLWLDAEHHWDVYVARSSAASARVDGAGGAIRDPWLPIARLRREHAHVERIAAQKRGARLPARRGDRTWTID
jgi:tetratricopeptide (TPR) repeat protein